MFVSMNMLSNACKIVEVSIDVSLWSKYDHMFPYDDAQMNLIRFPILKYNLSKVPIDDDDYDRFHIHKS